MSDNAAQNDAIFDVTPESFQADVIDRSRQVPIVLLFWAEQMVPAAAARRALVDLVPRYQGKVLLGLIDVALDQGLAQHLRVQSLPSLRVVSDGQIAAQLDGPQSDQAFIDLLDQLTLSSADALRAQLDGMLESRAFDQALALLQQAIQEEPNNQAFRVELADVLLRQAAADRPEAIAEARQILAAIPEGTENLARPVARLSVLEEVAGIEAQHALEARLHDDPDDLEANYQLALHLTLADRHEEALERALHVLRTDRTYRDELGRLTMIRIFDLLGKGSELASRYRRILFNHLH